MKIYFNESHEKTKTNNKLITIANIVCVAKDRLFLCVVNLNCHPKND